MASGDGHICNNFKEQLLLKQIDCVNDTFKMALYSDVYSSTQIDGNPVYSSSNEISPANYTAGGKALVSPAVAQDDTNDRASWDANDLTWTSLGTATIQRSILYDDTTASKWQLIIWEIGTNSNGGNYTLQFHTNGIMLLS